MPRLKCTFAEFIAIIKANGFQPERQSGGSHAVWRREAGGAVHKVVVAAHSMTDDIKPGTLASMVRQSGLPKRLFRK